MDDRECTGRVQIDGLIDGRGANGNPGRGSGGSGPGIGLDGLDGLRSLGGTGGNGRRTGLCGGVILTPFEPDGYSYDPHNYDSACLRDMSPSIGKPATDRSGATTQAEDFIFRYGFGGLPGNNGGLLDDLGAILVAFAEIVGTALDFAACVTTGTTCVALVPDVAVASAGVNDLIEHFNDTRGRGLPGSPGEPSEISALSRGHSGGGGGGGGYDYIFGTDPGGGGGGGGGGGRGIEIIAGGNVYVGGMLDARGGNGGNGSEDSSYYPGRGAVPTPRRFSGGGGGAGSGGDILIRTLGTAFIPTSLTTNRGGFPGVGGLTITTTNYGTILVRDPSSRNGEDGRYDWHAAPPPTSGELVLTRRLYEVTGSGLASPVTLVVRGESGATRRSVVNPGQPAQLMLFDGFNHIYDERLEVAAGTDPNDATFSPRLTWVSGPASLDLSRPEIAAPPWRIRLNSNPVVISQPRPLELIRPATDDQTGGTNTTMALPPYLYIQRPL